MIYPSDRFRFSSSRPRKKNRWIVPVIIVSIFAVGAVVTLFITHRSDTPATDNGSVILQIPEETSLYELWRSHEYDKLIELTSSRLRQSPMDPLPLVFYGFSSFYKGAAQMTLDEKLPLLDEAIHSLRKALIIENIPYSAEVNYILGKAYYQKGKYFADLSVEYIEKSLDKGYRGEDSFEYLGLAYMQLGRYEESIDSFLNAINVRPSDLLYFTLSQTYFQVKKLDEAEQYLLKAVEISEDTALKEKCRFLLGEIYSAQNELQKAEAEYREITSANPNSARCFFLSRRGIPEAGRSCEGSCGLEKRPEN